MALHGMSTFLGVLFLSLLIYVPIASAEINITPGISDYHPWILDRMNPGQYKLADGDVYNRTKCYCRRPEVAPPETHWYGSYFHITYFNFHTKRLYSLEFVCKSNQIDDDFGDTECSPLQDQSKSFRGGEHTMKGCMYSEEKIGDSHPDHWCYHVQRQWSHRDETFFNKQKRRLEYRGRPKFMYEPQVNVECHRLCKEKVEPGMAVLYYWQNPNNPIAGNLIDTYEEVDDMCDGCKK